jgi:hypothetical protein
MSVTVLYDINLTFVIPTSYGERIYFLQKIEGLQWLCKLFMLTLVGQALTTEQCKELIDISTGIGLDEELPHVSSIAVKKLHTFTLHICVKQ